VADAEQFLFQFFLLSDIVAEKDRAAALAFVEEEMVFEMPRTTFVETFERKGNGASVERLLDFVAELREKLDEIQADPIARFAIKTADTDAGDLGDVAFFVEPSGDNRKVVDDS